MDVLTLTGNLLAEWTLTTGELNPGATHRASQMSFQVGGKGINVSRVLGRIGVRSSALAFASGPMGDQCSQWLSAQNIVHRLFPLGAMVRPGMVVRTADGSVETTFLGCDNPVPPSSWQAAIREGADARPAWLAVCGSIPGWQGDWAKPLDALMDSGIRVCADTYGAPLRDLAALPLSLVKINRAEMERSWPELAALPTAQALRRLRKMSPVGTWVVTDGARRISSIQTDGTLLELEPAQVREVSPTGCGDTLLAVLLAEWELRGDFGAALAEAAACATASAGQSGIGEFPLPVPTEYRPRRL